MQQPKTISLEIRLENAAFSDSQETEVARILRELANHIEPPDREEWRGAAQLWYVDSRRLIDINGNTVGKVMVR